MDGTILEAAVSDESLELSAQTLGALPIVDAFLARMGLDELLGR